MRTAIFLLISCFFGHCYAQQDPQFTMNWNNYSLFNPAATGLAHKQYAALVGRHQWVGIGGEPKTFSFNYNAKLSEINSGRGFALAHALDFNILTQ